MWLLQLSKRRWDFFSKVDGWMAFLSFSMGDGLELKWSTIALWNWTFSFFFFFLLLSVKGRNCCVGGSWMVPYVPRWEISIPWGARGFPSPSSCCFLALADGGEVCCCHLVWGVTWSYGLKARAIGRVAVEIQVHRLVVPFLQIKIAFVCASVMLIQLILQGKLPLWRTLLIFCVEVRQTSV